MVCSQHGVSFGGQNSLISMTKFELEGVAEPCSWVVCEKPVGSVGWFIHLISKLNSRKRSQCLYWETLNEKERDLSFCLSVCLFVLNGTKIKNTGNKCKQKH